MSKGGKRADSSANQLGVGGTDFQGSNLDSVQPGDEHPGSNGTTVQPVDVRHPGTLDSARDGRAWLESLKPGAGPKRIGPPPDDETRNQYPLLWEWITLDVYSDGSARILPEVLIRRIDGAYEIAVRDHASRQQKTAWFLSLEELPGALDDVLCDPTRPWKPYDSYLNPDPDKPGQKTQKRS